MKIFISGSISINQLPEAALLKLESIMSKRYEILIGDAKGADYNVQKVLAQNGYNPRRSGDVIIVLDPERIELDSKRVAMSGSAYNYDRHIPFVVSGAGLAPQQVAERVSNEQIAPTLAALMGVERPQCSDSEVIIIK